jgi:hypothetical protein
MFARRRRCETRLVAVISVRRVLVRSALALLVLFLTASVDAATSVAQRGPVVLHAQWRLVATHPRYVAASDRYVAVIKEDGDPDASRITLTDEQTRRTQVLSVPGCSQAMNLVFGGPWLMVPCASSSYELYNLNSRRWVTVTASQQLCQPLCAAEGVGGHWVKFSTVDGCVAHCIPAHYLQDIDTAEVRSDPATPGGLVYDDLSAASGSRPLCSPLRYPRAVPAEAGVPGRWELGTVTFEGRFALTAGSYHTSDGIVPIYRLRRCGAPLDLRIPAITPPGPVISSSAVLWQPTNTRLAGRFLPSLQPFTIAHLPPRAGPSEPVILAGLSQCTVYVTTGSKLWAAPLPRDCAARIKPSAAEASGSAGE